MIRRFSQPMISHARHIARIVEDGERMNAEELYRKRNAERLALACGTDRVVRESIGDLTDPDVAERAAEAIAGRRWHDAEFPSAHAAGTGEPAEGTAG